MKGTYDDHTKFYLEIFHSDAEPSIEDRNQYSTRIHYDSVDGLNLEQFILHDLSNLSADVDTNESYNLHMQLYGWRKIQVAESNALNQKMDDNCEIGSITDWENNIECIGAVRLDLGKSYKDLKIEQIFALEIEKNWSDFCESQKRVALCFLERYVLPFETVREFSQTGKLDLSSFEDTYGKRK